MSAYKKRDLSTNTKEVEVVFIGQITPLADTWMHGDWAWGWMTLMMVVMVLFWGAVIFGIVWLIRAAVDGGRGQRRESPTEVLERRFAEGAISVEDYRARRQILAVGRTVPPRTSG